MEGMTAKWYAANTAEMMNEYVTLAQRIGAQLAPGSAVLEVAPGPGYFSIELARLGAFQITGLDLSRTFVRLATMQAAKAHVSVEFLEGSASSLPFPARSFDFVVCRAAFKNFAKPDEALHEMSRVLRPGGRALIIDLKADATPDAIREHIDAMGLSTVNRILTRLVFKTMLLKRAYSREQFQEMLWEVNFSNVEINEDAMGFEIWLTK
ncbi:MAG TPA: class I SAM-dependent methyltransferase [Terracidiphilus sp.]